MFPIQEEFGLKGLRYQCEKSTSRIFGFIMYTRRHSYIAKVLKDDDFWNELDEISGPRWPIFAVRPLRHDRYTTYNRSFSEPSQKMVQTCIEPDENKKYLEVFSLDKLSDLPCFIVFIWNDDEELEQFTFKLSNRNIEEAFDSIREIVSIISETERQILPEYRQTENVFRNAKADIKGVIFQKKIKKSFKHFHFLYDFMSVFWS